VGRKINAGDSSGETADRATGVTAFATSDTLVLSPDCNDRARFVRKILKDHGELYVELRRGYRRVHSEICLREMHLEFQDRLACHDACGIVFLVLVAYRNRISSLRIRVTLRGSFISR